jgi:hypothetical protein
MFYQFSDDALDAAFTQALKDYEQGTRSVFPLAAEIIEAVYPDGCPENVVEVFKESLNNAGKDITVAHVAYLEKAIKNGSGETPVVAPAYAALAAERRTAEAAAAQQRRNDQLANDAAAAQAEATAVTPDAPQTTTPDGLPLPTTPEVPELPILAEEKAFGTLMNNIRALTTGNEVVRKNTMNKPQRFVIQLGAKENGRWEEIQGFDVNTLVRPINHGIKGLTEVITRIAAGEDVTATETAPAQDEHTPETGPSTDPAASGAATEAEPAPATDAVTTDSEAETLWETTHGIDVTVTTVAVEDAPALEEDPALTVEVPSKYPAKKRKK